MIMHYMSREKEKNIMIVCLYVDDLNFLGIISKMFEDFKQAIIKGFEITDIEIMSYYLDIEVKQAENEIFITKYGYARELLKKFEMNNCQPAITLAECGVRLFKNDKKNWLIQSISKV